MNFLLLYNNSIRNSSLFFVMAAELFWVAVGVEVAILFGILYFANTRTYPVLAIDIEHGGPRSALIAIGVAICQVSAHDIVVKDKKRWVFDIDEKKDIDPACYNEFWGPDGITKGKLLPKLREFGVAPNTAGALREVVEFVTKFYDDYPTGRPITDYPSGDIGRIDRELEKHTNCMPLEYQPLKQDAKKNPKKKAYEFRSSVNPDDLLQGFLESPLPVRGTVEAAMKQLWPLQKVKLSGKHSHDPVDDALHVVDMYHLFLKLVDNREKLRRFILGNIVAATVAGLMFTSKKF